MTKHPAFLMDNKFQPIPTAEGWQLSNPPILSMAAVRASLDLFDRIGFEKLVSKSKRLTGFFIECLENMLPNEIEIVTPKEENSRGCQLSLKVNLQGVEGKTIYEQLENAGIRSDWREPNVIRAAPVPLYNSFFEVFEFSRQLKQILAG